MEPKKNPEVDVHKKRTLIFNFSLVLSLVVIITAFKWSAPIPRDVIRPDVPARTDDYAYIPITDFNNVPDQPKPLIKTISRTVNPNFVEVKQLVEEVGTETNDIAPPVNALTIDPLFDFAWEDTVTTDFFKVETPPQPVKGYAAFYKMLGENLKYPRRAVRNRIEGKVFVEFTVERNGEPVNLKIVRGISQECDAESLRVIALSRWTPGKQRGKPVRVKMILPVTFALR